MGERNRPLNPYQTPPPRASNPRSGPPLRRLPRSQSNRTCAQYAPPRTGTAAAAGAATAGVSAAPARQLPGWRHGSAGPRPRPSLPPAPTCAEFVYLAAMATRGGAVGGRGEEREGAGPGGGPQRTAGRRRGRAGAEKLSKERAAAAGSSPARDSERGCGRAGSRGGGGRRRHREPPSAPPRPSGPPPTHPPAASAHGRARPAQPPGLRTPRRRPVRRSAPLRPVSPGGAARPPTRPQPQRPRRQPRRPRQWWRTLLS